MSSEIAAFLRRIPRSDQSPRSIHTLADGCDPSLLTGYVMLLQTIGVVVVNETGEIQAVSQTGKYMLESLASYVEAELTWVDDWTTRGIYPEDNNNPLQNGATLLHVLEARRASLLTNPRPARREIVAQVIIKRTSPDTHQPELLFQYDRNARRYQLIGGRKKDHESIESTMVREIEEELINQITYGEDYELALIVENLTPEITLSPTFGALTSYAFWIYHMRNLNEAIELQEDDYWVPLDQVLNGYIISPTGEKMSYEDSDIYRLIDDRLENGILGLPDSFSQRQ